jgi:methionyl-tRNA formyltransferase
VAHGRRASAAAPRDTPLKLLFFGTPAFAVPTLERLLGGPHPVVAAVTQPDRPRGRGQRLSPSPVAAAAELAGIPALRTERAGEPAFVDRLRGYDAELGIVVAFGQFLPRRVRELPRAGFLINAHASLLPRHRGAAPIAHAILAGDAETGISVMRVDREMDAGPVASVRRTPIGADETTGALEQRLAQLAADAIEEAVARAAAGELRWTDQDATRATFAPKITSADAQLDWSEPAVVLARRVRAMAPRPGAWTSWDGERLRILRSRALPADAPADGGAAPGTVRIDAAASALRIATGAGWLEPLALQRAGGKPLEVADFQRGRGLADGVRLGAP